VAIFEWLCFGLLLLAFFFLLDLSLGADAFMLAPVLSAWTPVGRDAEIVSHFE
jgi:hypothetical protein